MRKCLLDTSFVIDLLNEIADQRPGPALAWLQRNAAARIWISPVTLAEVLEGAAEPEAVKSYLARYSWQGIHRVHAEKVGLRQKQARSRMGENDAWQAAIAECMGATLLAHDRAFQRLSATYEDYRRSESRG